MPMSRKFIIYQVFYVQIVLIYAKFIITKEILRRPVFCSVLSVVVSSSFSVF